MPDEPLVDLNLTVNGEHHTGQVPADMPLVHFLHSELGLTGTKIGCSIGECRACTVAVRVGADGAWVTRQACMTSMRHTRGWDVTTVEGLAVGDALHPVQDALLKHSAFQCGYCAAGFAVAGAVAVEQTEPGDDEATMTLRIDAILGPHQCRCTGYGRYREAILAAACDAAAVSKTEPSQRRHGDAGPADHRPPRQDDASGRVVTGRVEGDAKEYSPLFNDPALEIVRMLRDGAEIEHCLMIQYLYAAFSVKVPEYTRLAGWASHRYGGRPLHLMGVAIEEMTHLDIVNDLLLALGSAPYLGRQQFPYRNDIYPFEFALEPLNLCSLAKYVYVEASSEAVARDQHDPRDQEFVDRLYKVLKDCSPEHEVSPDQIGSLYHSVAEVMKLLEEREPDRLDYATWAVRLHVLQEEGESEHFELFRALFEGKHPALPGPGNIWERPPAEHPVRQLCLSSGLPERGEPIPGDEMSALRHLSNLHYWAVCMLLDRSYRIGGQLHSAARRHMTGPLNSIGTALARENQGVPFDVFAPGYAPGLGERENFDLTRRMLQEIVVAQERYGRYLPPDYALTCAHETLWELSVLERRWPPATAAKAQAEVKR